MLQFRSDTMVVTPWLHGVQVRDTVLNEEYFLNIDDLRAIYVAIMAHSERNAIIRVDDNTETAV